MSINWNSHPRVALHLTFAPMGRVSKYKKVKACDPFYKGPRRDLQRKDNLRPENEDDQPVPKSVIRLMKSAQQISIGKKRRKQQSSIIDKGRVDSRSKSSGKVDKKAEPTSEERGKREPMFQRRKGESLKAYFERIDVEANSHIMESFRKERKKSSDKRKKYLENRRKKLKSRKRLEEEEEEALVDFSDLKDEVKFGEVVTAPPRLAARPRGSHKKSIKGPTTLLLQEKLNPKASSVPNPAMGLKRKQDLVTEREKAIEMYRQTKKVKHTKNRTE